MGLKDRDWSGTWRDYAANLCYAFQKVFSFINCSIQPVLALKGSNRKRNSNRLSLQGL